MTLAGEALSKLYWYDRMRFGCRVAEPVNEARFADLLYCGIDDTGLLAVGVVRECLCLSGLVSGRGCGLLAIALVGLVSAGSGPRTVGLSASVRCTCSNQSMFQVSDRKLPVAVQCFCVDGDWGKFF